MEDRVKYIRVSEPNKDELARLVKNAKGPSRTMKEFGNLCGVDPSTLSRIVNKKNRGPSSDDLIRSIAEHADPDSGVTLDKLMAAHGMARVLDSSRAVKLSALEFEEAFKNTMIYEQEQAGSLIGYAEDAKFQIGTTLRFQMDLLIYSKDIKGDSNLWGFELLMPSLSRLDEKNGGGNTSRTTQMIGKMILDRMGKVLPLFYTQKENGERLGKFSFVVADGELYKYAVSEFENYCVPFEMSLILFNCGKERIEDEFILKRG